MLNKFTYQQVCVINIINLLKNYEMGDECHINIVSCWILFNVINDSVSIYVFYIYSL